MTFPRYPAYEASGIGWLGDVPQGWAVSRLADLCSKVGSGKTPNGGAEVYSAEGVLFLRSQNVHDEGLRLDDIVCVPPDIDADMSSTRVLPGDVLLNITGASLGRSCIAPSDLGPANVNQHVCIVRARQPGMAEFLALAMKSASVKAQIDASQNGAAREGLNYQQVRRLVVACPPERDRHAIVVFLLRETAKIDALIAEQERLVVLLREKQQALISQTVTSGFEIGGPMKASGAEWLGQVPNHWRIERARRLFEERDERSMAGDEELLTVSHLTGVTPRSEKNVYMFEAETNEGYKVCRPGDLVINTLWAWMGAMGVSPVHGIVSPAYHVYTPATCLDPAYVNALVRVPVFAQEVARYSKGVWASRLRLYPEDFFRIVMPVPPMDEQRVIAAHVETETTQMSALVTEAERSIVLLKERRAALISAAVTGKIDVRGAVPVAQEAA